jgi:hypothetical protein
MQNQHWKSSVAFGLMATISFTSAWAQEVKQTVINLWPGVAPGSEQWKQLETALGSGEMERIVNVTTPTLTAYLPDPSTATGTAVIIAPGGGFIFLGMKSEGHDVAKWLVARGIAAFVLKYRTAQIEGQNEAQLNQSGGARFGAQLRDHALIAEDGKYAIADGIQAVKVVRAHAYLRRDRPVQAEIFSSLEGRSGTAAGVDKNSAARRDREQTLARFPHGEPLLPLRGIKTRDSPLRFEDGRLQRASRSQVRAGLPDDA